MFSHGPKAGYPWVLKGGYAMELRMHSARTTKDIDLALHDGTRLSKTPKERAEQVRALLQEAADRPLTITSNSWWEKQDRIWMALRKAAIGIPSKQEGRNRLCALSRRCRRQGRSDRAPRSRNRRRLAQLRRRGSPVFSDHFCGAAVCGKASCVHTATRRAREY